MSKKEPTVTMPIDLYDKLLLKSEALQADNTKLRDGFETLRSAAGLSQALGKDSFRIIDVLDVVDAALPPLSENDDDS
jgi:hypothetical protein